MKIYSNDYFDFIAEREKIPESVCVQALDTIYDSLYYRREGKQVDLERYTYVAVPKCYTLQDQTALEDSGIIKVQNQPSINLKGQGILMGFLDTGIDLNNPVFQYSNGDTRVAAVWDQTQEDGPAPEGFLYGREYLEEEINHQLKDKGSLPRDMNGHGTYVAGVAAGSHIADQDFIGAAPECKIAMVKLKEAKNYLREFYHIPNQAVCYQENDLMAGVRYLDALALKLELPLVICVSIGSNMGNHSGTGPLSEMLGTLGTQKGHCVVCAAGNEAGQRHHYAGSIQKDEVQIVELRVDEKTKGFTMELWSEAPQVLGISILSPSGEVVPKLPLPITGKQVHKFIFEDTTVTVDYQMVGSKSADQLIFFNFDQPVVGIWKIYVYPETLSTGEYNLWLPTHNFVDGNVIFVESNPDITVTNPANSQLVITAGAYDTSNRSLYLDSGRGYNILDNVKPDLTAPGVRVYGPGIADSYTTRTGTSAAAAVMAGASTLYMQWSYYQKKNLNVNTAEIRNALQRGADKPGVRVYPNNEWGYGILNLYSTFEKMRISTT